jgi:DNA polymerase-3 subunit alpha/error-prone DNA polymerase
MMLSFDGYSFCKPHSASYAMVSFQSAYLRIHHPAEFMAAVLSNQGGYYRPGAYISEARRMGLGILGPDVNASRYHYHGESGDGGPGTVIVGLMAIARLSRGGAEAIGAERDGDMKRPGHGRFNDLAGFSRRVGLSRDDIAALTAAGAFDSLAPGMSRALIARTLLCAASAGKNGGAEQGSLFETVPRATHIGAVDTGTAVVTRHGDAELRDEYAALGFLRNRHPFALWERELRRIDRIHARELPDCIGRFVRLIGWPVTQKEVLTANGLEMDFVSFEDEAMLYETVLFPEAYGKYRPLLLDQRPLVVEGQVIEDQGAITVEVRTIRRVS